MSPSLSGKILKNKWKLGSMIGRGGCAEVYEVTDIQSQSSPIPFVAKIAPLPSGLPPAMKKGKKRKKTDQEKHADMIYYEYTLYKGFLLGHDGVVQIPVGGYGEDQNLRYLVMTRLGPDIEAAQAKSGPWSVARVAGYGRMMLNLLRSLHEKCKMVFVDVKPENFMFGYPGSPDEDKIFLIDFGLSFRYTGREGTIKPQANSAQVQGTPEFLSLKCHGGASPGRCDDLESLGYVILSLLKGGSPSPLPWSGSKSVADGLAKKKKTSLEKLCDECPAPMLEFMKTVRGMEYEDIPDYDGLDAILFAMEKAEGSAGNGPAPGRGKSAATTKRDKGKARQNPQDGKEVREVVSSGKRGSGEASAALATAVSPERPASRRSPRLSLSPKKKNDSRSTVLSPSVEGKGGRGSGGGRPTRSRKHGKADQNGDADADDDEGFFDAEQGEVGDNVNGDAGGDGDEEELEVVKVVTGSGKGSGTRKSGRAAAAVAADRAIKKGSRRSSAKEFVLEVYGGPHEGKVVRLKNGGAEVRVGRSAPRAGGLRFDKDMEVSDRHAVMRPKEDGIHYEDLCSLNGSFVNEERLEGEVVLKAGDILQVGQSVVRITTK